MAYFGGQLVLVTLNFSQMNQEEKIIKPKLGLLELAKQLGNVYL